MIPPGCRTCAYGHHGQCETGKCRCCGYCLVCEQPLELDCGCEEEEDDDPTIAYSLLLL